MQDIKLQATLQTVCAQRDQIKQALEELQEKMQEVRGLLAATDFLGSFKAPSNRTIMELADQCDEGTRRGNIEDRIARDGLKGVDRAAWMFAYKAIGFDRLLDNKRKNQLHIDMSKGDFPEFTEENALQQFEQLFAQREHVFAEGLMDCWRTLDPKHKCNGTPVLGKKIVVSEAIYFCHHPNQWSGHNLRPRCDHLNDLLRQLKVLDNRPHDEQSFSGWFHLQRGSGDVFEHEYFTMKVFANGNAHLIFKRMDLIDKANKIISSRLLEAA